MPKRPRSLNEPIRDEANRERLLRFLSREANQELAEAANQAAEAIQEEENAAQAAQGLLAMQNIDVVEGLLELQAGTHDEADNLDDFEWDQNQNGYMRDEDPVYPNMGAGEFTNNVLASASSAFDPTYRYSGGNYSQVQSVISPASFAAAIGGAGAGAGAAHLVIDQPNTIPQFDNNTQLEQHLHIGQGAAQTGNFIPISDGETTTDDET